MSCKLTSIWAFCLFIYDLGIVSGRCGSTRHCTCIEHKIVCRNAAALPKIEEIDTTNVTEIDFRRCLLTSYQPRYFEKFPQLRLLRLSEQLVYFQCDSLPLTPTNFLIISDCPSLSSSTSPESESESNGASPAVVVSTVGYVPDPEAYETSVTDSDTPSTTTRKQPQRSLKALMSTNSTVSPSSSTTGTSPLPKKTTTRKQPRLLLKTLTSTISTRFTTIYH